MSIAVAGAAAKVIGVLTSPGAKAITTVLTGANTVIGGVSLKNDVDIKARIDTTNSRLSDIQNQLDEIQAISESGANKTDVKALFAAIHQPPAQAIQAPPQAPVQPVQPVQQIPVQQPAPQPPQTQPTPPQSDDMPEWAKAIIEQQNKIMAQNTTPGGTPAATNVTVNNQPPVAAEAAPPASQPSSIDEKLDKLIGVVGVLANAIIAPADPADPVNTPQSDASEPPASPTGSGK